jgi:hypothetical protein
VNEKSQATQEGRYSEEGKRGRASGIMKEVAVLQKSTEKQKGRKEKQQTGSSLIPGSLEWLWGKLKIQSRGRPDSPGNRLAILAAR